MKEDIETTPKLKLTASATAALGIGASDAEVNAALMEAIGDDDVEAVKLLLNAGANMDAVDKVGFTPLTNAIDFGDNNFHRINTMKVLLDHRFKLSEVLAKYIIVDKEFVTEPITLELSKASNSKYIAGMSAVILNAKEKHFGKYLEELLNVIKQNQKELTQMFARWNKLNKTDKFAFHKLVQGELTEKQCEAFADEKPELYKFGQGVLKLVGADAPKVLKFVSNFMKLNQQKMLPYKEMMLSMLCLDKLKGLTAEKDFSCPNVFIKEAIEVLEATMVIKYSEKNKKIFGEFIEGCVHSKEIKSWLLNDFMTLSIEEHSEKFFGRSYLVIFLGRSDIEKGSLPVVACKRPKFDKTASKTADEQDHSQNNAVTKILKEIPKPAEITAVEIVLEGSAEELEDPFELEITGDLVEDEGAEV